MVIMASGIARGCVRTTTTTTMAMVELHKMVDRDMQLGLLCTSLIVDIHVMIN